MLIVKIIPEYFSTLFQESNFHEHLFIAQGLPEGSKLVKIEYDQARDEHVKMYFSHPKHYGEPDKEITIIMTTNIPDTPSEQALSDDAIPPEEALH